MADKSIKHSVGKYGVNKHADVVIVQNLLNKFIAAKQMDLDPLVPDGISGQLTRSAIGIFQGRFLGHNKPDQRVDPNKATLNALNGPVDQPQIGDPHDRPQKSVARVLREADINSIRFTLGTDTVDPSDFFQIASRFENRTLRAYHDPGQGESAEYFHRNDENVRGYMLVGFHEAMTSTQKSVIVHEATHAVCDARARMMMVDRSEAIAHLAQAIYYYATTGRHLRVANMHTTDVLSHCGNIAIRLKTNNTTTVSSDDHTRLLELVRRLPTYKPNTGFFYDGV